MSRRPLSPDIWEQALLNGRRIHASDDRAAQQWAQQWYEAQGGKFDGEAVAAPEPEPEVNAPAPEPEPEPVEEPAEEQPRRSSRGKRRSRHDDGQFKGDDPATPDVNEAWDGGDAA